MHRSGTSALARGLLELGVALGEELMPARPENPKGFWENMDVLSINERLLERIGLRWDSLIPGGKVVSSILDAPDLHEEAQDVLSRNTSGGQLWGFKEPRTVLVLPFWQSVFASLDLEPCYVIATRHPLSVVSSLKARNAIPAEKSTLLWLQAARIAVEHTRGTPRVVVDYDLLLDDPTRQLRRIANAFSLEASASGASTSSSYCHEFLTSELRHTRYGPTEFPDVSPFTPCIKGTYGLLLEAAADRVSLDEVAASHVWTDAGRLLDDLAPLSLYIRELEKQVCSREAEIARLIAVQQEFSANEATMNLRLEQMDANYQIASRELLRVRQVAERRAMQIASLHASISWRVSAPIRFVARHSARVVDLFHKWLG